MRTPVGSLEHCRIPITLASTLLILILHLLQSHPMLSPLALHFRHVTLLILRHKLACAFGFPLPEFPDFSKPDSSYHSGLILKDPPYLLVPGHSLSV